MIFLLEKKAVIRFNLHVLARLSDAPIRKSWLVSSRTCGLAFIRNLRATENAGRRRFNFFHFVTDMMTSSNVLAIRERINDLVGNNGLQKRATLGNRQVLLLLNGVTRSTAHGKIDVESKELCLLLLFLSTTNYGNFVPSAF